MSVLKTFSRASSEETSSTYKAYVDYNGEKLQVRTSKSPRRNKVWQCDQCPKFYSSSGHLSRHKRSHRDEKPYKCPIEGCPAAFIRPDNLKSHHTRHLANIDDPNWTSNAVRRGLKEREERQRKANESSASPLDIQVTDTMETLVNTDVFMPQLVIDESLANLINLSLNQALLPVEQSILPDNLFVQFINPEPVPDEHFHKALLRQQLLTGKL